MGPLFLGYAEVNSLKAVVATAGTALLALRLFVSSEALGALGRRAWDAALLALGVLSAALWWNLFQFNYPDFGHPSETYHYYLGSKYFEELRYTRLYRCTAVADAEAGLVEQVGRRSLRNLETNVLEPAAPVLEDPESCKRHFSPERWRSFAHDVGWFRAQVTKRNWEQGQTDHGYNGTPTWGLFGALLASTGPASDVQITALRLVDVGLLLATWAFVAATFGWRTLCVALLFWGTNYPALYGWIGGSYLRQLEFAAVLAALCFMRRGRHGVAGYLLGAGVLVRVYPALLLLAPGLQALLAMWHERRLVLAPAHRQLLLGGLLAAATLLPLSAISSGGFGAWLEFAENSRVLLGTPLRNHVGLRTVLAYDHAARSSQLKDSRLQDPFETWKRAREDAFARRRLAFAGLAAGFLALLAAAVRRQPEWVAVALGAGVVPVLAELTCYYMLILVVYALLWKRYPPVGVALCGLSALGWLLVERFLFFDEIFSWISLATVAFVVLATAWVWRVPPGKL